MSKDMWQKCPVCNGFQNVLGITCHVCRGSGIISVLNGAPPDWAGRTITKSGTDFVIPDWIIEHNKDPENH
jgi:hypothetical protein